MDPSSYQTGRSPLFAVFPGQGSQFVGMGKDLYENFGIARQVFEEASDAIHIDLKNLCFFGDAAQLTLTENTQPCLLVTSIAAFRVAEQELGFSPDAVIGHSLGEYSALVANKSIGLRAATQWVRQRGSAMQASVPSGQGSMAAILNLEDTWVEALCRRATQLAEIARNEVSSDSSLSVPAWVEPANYNSPGQVVIAGSIDAITQAMMLVRSEP